MNNIILSQVAIPELVDLIASEVETRMLRYNSPKQDTKQFAYSIKEGAEKFGVSSPTFQKWKNDGYVSYAQNGRSLIIDIPDTMQLLKNRTKKKF